MNLYETDLSAQKTETTSQTRLSSSDGYCKWSQDFKTASLEGASPTYGLVFFMQALKTLNSIQAQKLFQNSYQLTWAPFLVFFRYGQQPPSRYAIAVSRKLTTRAYLKNRIRRQIRPLIATFLVTPLPIAVVFLVLEGYFSYSKTEITKRFMLLITKLQTLCHASPSKL